MSQRPTMFAVLRLSDEQKQATAKYPILTEKDFRPARYAQNRQYAAIVGFPATASKYLRKERLLKTEACSIANMVTQEGHGRIAVKFEKHKNVRAGVRGQISAPDPYGMSGGAIFSVPSTILSIHPAEPVKLAGIATHWRRSRALFEGTSIEIVKALILETQ
jgi:hypothetical protein